MATTDRVAARLRELFGAVPAIVGFAFDPEPGHSWSNEACAEVEAYITTFAPERGRTFARSLQ
jgi:hypothetical protein